MDERPSEGSSQIVAERPVETTSSAYGVTMQVGVLERPLRCFSSFDEAREERKRVATNSRDESGSKEEDKSSSHASRFFSWRGELLSEPFFGAGHSNGRRSTVREGGLLERPGFSLFCTTRDGVNATKGKPNHAKEIRAQGRWTQKFIWA